VRPRHVGVDFARRELVLVSPGPRSSTGYGVRVLAVVERRRSILVRVRETTPSLGQPVQARVTYPYRLISIRRVGKPVRIDWQGH
jgi:protease stability complex PrcB-like protein